MDSTMQEEYMGVGGFPTTFAQRQVEGIVFISLFKYWLWISRDHAIFSRISVQDTTMS